MVPGPSPERAYGAAERAALLRVARESIAAGLRGEHLPVRPEEFSPALRAARACFVTINRMGRLRGCIGTLEARRALVLEVAAMARAAAFNDPRFTPLTADEAADMELHISVLGLPQPMQFRDEADLLAQLRPGVDGLILRDGQHQATFLPSVWEQLPDPREFLQRLKLKAGLAAEHWSPSMEVRRYSAESIP